MPSLHSPVAEALLAIYSNDDVLAGVFVRGQVFNTEYSPILFSIPPPPTTSISEAYRILVGR